ncbi:Uu.00g096770.m01.CDS01 [Anthostomella pinea]|uniref:Uu.00g096770.m01.CDS01 n=1 Tax=Anthostomella pinea TaxID=933095 RepID=A0AAI8V784_9PEZI|nr:Uu.00g096770.m01.CDS01 [Anthostomella pinea]
MKSFVLILLFTSTVTSTAILRPRQSNNGCCFGLTSVGTVNETVEESHGGNLLLGGSFQQGGFCLVKSTKTIQDTLNHNCFMTTPTRQFECFAGIVGATAFDVLANADGKSYLHYDNGPGLFYACPIGSGADQYYDIFSTAKADSTGCIQVALALHNPSGACSASNTTSSSGTSVLRATSSAPLSTQTTIAQSDPSVTSAFVAPGYSYVPGTGAVTTIVPSGIVRPQSTSSTSAAPKSTAAASRVCSIAASAPSIAPFKVATPNNRDQDTSTDVLISTNNSALFQYVIPGSFLPIMADAAKPPLCALQFRMPVCTELPKGYPCYSFSGLEQEILSNSGMAFALSDDDAAVPVVASWNATELHQVFPGENSILGTFECGKPAGSYGAARKMTWRASSVRSFSLEFLQAGVGADAQFQDGIGAWILPCS